MFGLMNKDGASTGITATTAEGGYGKAGKRGDKGSGWVSGGEFSVAEVKGDNGDAGGLSTGTELALRESKGGENVVGMELESGGKKRGADNQNTPARAGAMRVGSWR